MNPYRNIMIVIDPAMTHGTAFARGVALAEKSGAALILLLVGYSSELARARFLDPGIMQDAVKGYLSVRQRWLDTEVAKLQEQGIRARGIVCWHNRAHEEIARQAMETAPDIVIKDVEDTSRLARVVFTPAEWHLLRLCPAPLMLVNAHSSSYPQRILAAVDPFDTNDKPAQLNDDILRASLAMAYQCEARVDVVHAYQYLPGAVPMGAEIAVSDPALFEQVREEHRRRFIAFGESHGIPAERMHLLEGRPANVIATLAEDINADLVVLGTVQRSGLERVLMGSTAEDMLGAINSDVLVLKPAEFAAALEAELRRKTDET